MNRYQYNDLIIEVLNDPTYRYGSSDNDFAYLKHYFDNLATEYPTSNHGIKLYQNNEIIDSCVLIGSGSATGINKNSSLLDNDQLIICCCDTIFCLTLPNLELKWQTQADDATCFQLFKLEDDYLVHGELLITRLDNVGKIKWQFGGADIFVSIEGEQEFVLAENHILLTDFGNRKYKIDFDGKSL